MNGKQDTFRLRSDSKGVDILQFLESRKTQRSYFSFTYPKLALWTQPVVNWALIWGSLSLELNFQWNFSYFRWIYNLQSFTCSVWLCAFVDACSCVMRSLRKAWNGSDGRERIKVNSQRLYKWSKTDKKNNTSLWISTPAMPIGQLWLSVGLLP